MNVFKILLPVMVVLLMSCKATKSAVKSQETLQTNQTEKKTSCDSSEQIKTESKSILDTKETFSKEETDVLDVFYSAPDSTGVQYVVFERYVKTVKVDSSARTALEQDSSSNVTTSKKEMEQLTEQAANCTSETQQKTVYVKSRLFGFWFWFIVFVVVCFILWRFTPLKRAIGAILPKK